MKKIISVLLCALIFISALTACADNKGTSESSAATRDSAAESKPKEPKLHTLTIRTEKKIDEISAVFLNTSNGKTADVKMKKNGGDENNNIFSCEADVNLYNMVSVKYGEKSSMDVAFNSFVSGWNLEDDLLLPYVAGKNPVYDPKLETKVLKFDGRDKLVYIWKPKDYDKNADEKYPVIYMFDGQSIFTIGKDKGMDNDAVCWNVAEHVESMMEATGNKAIVVGIENNDFYRWDELVPDLGEINTKDKPEGAKEEDLSKKRGSDFAKFVCDTVMPYVNENYNVYTDPQHTALAGASLGGLETFYTVLSYPDRFGTGGVMSATLDMYAEKEWNEFLKDKMNMENAPFLYFYAGKYNGDNGDASQDIYNKLIENGYAKDKLVFSKYESGDHMIDYWRSIYPEFLEAVYTHNVTGLEYAVPVKYKDTSDPLKQALEDLDINPDDIVPGYIYYDNSETKWDEVYAYWWGGMAFNSFTGEPYYFAEWPGFKMEQVDNTDIYRVKAPWGNTGIIFDSGVTDREVAEGKDAFQTTDLKYNNDLIGKVYKIDMSERPKADPGAMKSKRRYSAGKWSDYSPEK
ncbi:MAG TPA: hypothetical protein DEO32_05405 [Ruminococcaceae bacterium]|nr:hypothetical protein [Oscillospiraceae bacterium]